MAQFLSYPNECEKGRAL
uniref:Uncharacterized protein n=1 Tax=Anguilla anguilla TaxID=7936 RepID=A0A0E9PX70_ANGAN